MAKVGEIAECACGCGMLFRVVSNGQRFKSRACARSFEYRQRNPPLSDEQIQAVLRAIEVELRKVLK